MLAVVEQQVVVGLAQAAIGPRYALFIIVSSQRMRLHPDGIVMSKVFKRADKHLAGEVALGASVMDHLLLPKIETMVLVAGAGRD